MFGHRLSYAFFTFEFAILATRRHDATMKPIMIQMLYKLGEVGCDDVRTRGEINQKMVPFQIAWRDVDGVPLMTSSHCVLIYKAFAPQWYSSDATTQLAESWGFGTPGKKHSTYCMCCHLSTRKARTRHVRRSRRKLPSCGSTGSNARKLSKA